MTSTLQVTTLDVFSVKVKGHVATQVLSQPPTFSVALTKNA